MERWAILATLTLARTSMGVQFQSVAALGPVLTAEAGLGYGLLGLLIGLYLAPGIVLALPGGWLGRRFGDKRLVLLGLFLMTAGGLLVAVSDGTAGLIVGRILSGAGAVILNVLVTKMVADWFSGRGQVTAMGLLITSWPVGIALAMVTLPPLAAAAGIAAALIAGSALAALSLVLVALVYRAPPGTPAGAPAGAPGLDRHETRRALWAGGVWSFYNAALILVLAFGPGLLVARGLDGIAAARTVSLVGWLIIPSLAAGGWIAARAGRPDAVMLGGFAVVAALILALPAAGAAPWAAVPLVVLIGVLLGPPGPLIMTLPVAAVRPANRALGMGIYFTCYYVAMAAVPALAGQLLEATGAPAVPLWLAALCLLLAALSLVLFRADRGAAPA